MATSPDAASGPSGGRTEGAGRFEVNLDNFSGPFDLLLSLIAKHKLDVTEVALGVVTDDFIAYLRTQDVWELEQASEFLVIGATLLDLKSARLLPGMEGEDPEDLELLEARDLLFARLLAYRAFKEVAGSLARRWESRAGAHPRIAELEPRFAALLPELVLAIGPEDLARIAAAALAPKPEPVVSIAHLHDPVVSVREQAVVVATRLRRLHVATFRTLTDDAATQQVVIGRFLALLELYREGVLAFEQPASLGELTIRWVGRDRDDDTDDDRLLAAGSSFDEEPGDPGDGDDQPGEEQEEQTDE
ncbi:condensin subunit ScpA [Salana multivorans]|uniref:Segregation and condensation protein A n=1 Tax=Salana multivorans TaxID=120377 RepID=A0A3N2D1G5_9MICO|nr:ScpA family protein [Salana multivorans]MBN8881583.1 segregation/condensation protein A [Salana multivorans]OJX94283.1 MAG: segregation/condensation protein A [Micrococcales bacterium 73-15]ROR93488.1 condensin subunit ScpA [Salana multivorans]